MFRYLFCAVISGLLHLLLWSQPVAEPITPTMLSSLDKPDNTMTLRILTAPPKEAQEPVKPEVPEPPPVPQKPEPELTKPKPPEKVEQKIIEKPKLKKPEKEIKKPIEEKKKPEPPKQPKKITEVVEKKVTKETEVAAAPAPQPERIVRTPQAPAASSSPMLIEKPQFKSRPTPPVYPRSARTRGQQGTVFLEIWLDEQGNQTKHIIAKSSGFDVLDRAALQAVKKWKFQGHKENGKGISSRVKVPVKFELS